MAILDTIEGDPTRSDTKLSNTEELLRKMRGIDESSEELAEMLMNASIRRRQDQLIDSVAGLNLHPYNPAFDPYMELSKRRAKQRTESPLRESIYSIWDDIAAPLGLPMTENESLNRERYERSKLGPSLREREMGLGF